MDSPFWRVTGGILLLAVAATAAAQRSASTSPPLAPPGRLIDLGGWRLHLNCTGPADQSRPTVILEAGIGDFSVEWSLVQPGVATFARVCSYDRAGDGWSDIGPQPRTMRQQVYELHALLEKAGLSPPFVMVGHSYGGWLVRTFRSTYPKEVVGMVLVEAGADDPVRVLEDGVPRHASDLVAGRQIPPAKTSDPLREADIPAGAYSQMQTAAAQFGPRANEPPRNKLPADAQRMRTWAYSQIKHWTQGNNPFEPEELALLRAERATSQRPYGDMPLIVLTRGLSDESGPDSQALLAEHRKEHEAVARLSGNGQLIVAAHSGHHVQIDEPQLVITAIQTVVAAVRKP
jgi:pimeloyl-ACP methyl ester carboxylesterase